MESTDLGEIGGFFQNLSTSFSNAFAAYNAPTQTPVPGSTVPGRPGYVYGPGGSVVAAAGVPGGQVVPGQVKPGTSWGTILLIGAVAVLGTAFLLSLRKK